MYWMDKETLFGGIVFSGIICLGSASYYHGISNYPPNPLLIYSTYPKLLNCGYNVFIPVDKLDYSHTIHLNYNLFVTDPERTVCDLVERMSASTEELCYESIDGYCGRFDIDKLIEYAEQRNLREKIEYMIGNVDAFFDNVMDKW